ncbi:MAG: hypothetical protein RSB14_05705 [Kiritimatiellia bacterium]
MKHLFLFYSLIPLSLFAGLASKEAYEPIIAAKPFGDMAAMADASAGGAEQQKQREELAQKFRMCGITDLPDGSRKIAFLDETNGVPTSYLLAEGETQNGFTLLSADYTREIATLRKEGLLLTLGLGKGLIDPPPEEEEKAEAVAEAAVALDVVAAPANANANHANANHPTTFRSRLIQRRIAQANVKDSEKVQLQNRVAAAEAEKIKALRRVQIERIKQGLAPTVPITLSAEEDAELEAAGVFGERKGHPPAGETL